jgi:hypothetical protein
MGSLRVSGECAVLCFGRCWGLTHIFQAYYEAGSCLGQKVGSHRREELSELVLLAFKMECSQCSFLDFPFPFQSQKHLYFYLAYLNVFIIASGIKIFFSY